MAYTKEELKQIVRDAANKYGIDENIALAQINQESGFNPTIGSNKGALGIAQFIASTAAQYGLTDRTDPVASMDAWGQYMSRLLTLFNGDYSLALAGYNAGEGNVKKYGGIPPFRETQNYVKSILGAANRNPTASPSVTNSPSGNEATMGTDGFKLESSSVLIIAAIAIAAYIYLR
jgi:soluble lytic murein transglycosylase-like protein